MSLDNKVRPTFTIKELQLIASACNAKVMELINNKQTNSPVLLAYVKIQTYCESFKPAQDNQAALLAHYMALAAGAKQLAPEQIQETIEQASTTMTAASFNDIEASYNKDNLSPIDNPDLTDDQRFDLLTLKGDKGRTEPENIWYLNKGTFIKMQRAMSTPVNERDL